MSRARSTPEITPLLSSRSRASALSMRSARGASDPPFPSLSHRGLLGLLPLPSRRRIDAPLKVIPAPVTDALLFVGRVVAAEGQDNPMIRDRVGEDLATAAAVVAIPLDRDEGKLGLEAGLSICVGHAIRRDRARGARPRSTERGEARRRRLRRCPAHRRRATVGAEGVQALRKHCRERFIVGRVRQAVSG
eukprot:scaffold5682_cov229-Pinguiococcus_pyrenoidosus.AAC.1